MPLMLFAITMSTCTVITKSTWDVCFMVTLAPYVGFQWHRAQQVVVCGHSLGCLPVLARCTCLLSITLMVPGAVGNSSQEFAELVWALNVKSLHVISIYNDREYYPCSSMLRNTQEWYLTTEALQNTGVNDLCTLSEIFTPHWGAKWGKWSVTNIPPFNTACEGTFHDEKYVQQPDVFVGIYANRLSSCMPYLKCVHRAGGLSLVKCFIILPVNIGGICLWE